MFTTLKQTIIARFAISNTESTKRASRRFTPGLGIEGLERRDTPAMIGLGIPTTFTITATQQDQGGTQGGDTTFTFGGGSDATTGTGLGGTFGDEGDTGGSGIVGDMGGGMGGDMGGGMGGGMGDGLLIA